MRYCDGVSQVHDPLVINDIDAVVAVCRLCKQQIVLRMDKEGRMNNRDYTKFFKRDILQPSENLYYKVHPEYLQIL